MSDNIKTCPFCGNVGKEMHANNLAFVIQCSKCKARTDFERCADDAISSWNMRVPTAPVEEVAGLVPLVLYFGSRDDADGFIADVQEAKPGMIKKHI